MKTLLELLSFYFLGTFATFSSEFSAQFLNREALEEGIIRAKKDFSCTLRIVVDLKPLHDDLKITILPAAIEKTLDDTLASLQRLKPNNHKKMLGQIENKGGKAAYLKHILDTPHLHGPQRPKVKGGYSEWVKFPGSLDIYTIDLGTYSVGSRGSATLVSVEGSQLKGLDNRVFVSAAHTFEHVFNSLEGKFPSELLQYASAQVQLDDNTFHSYRIKEPFVQKDYKNPHNNDIVIGILEEAVTGVVKPAKIQKNYFDGADRPVLPQVLWQCGFPGNPMVANAFEEVEMWFLERPLSPELFQQYVNKNLSFFLTQTKVAGCIIINGYDHSLQRCFSSYSNCTAKEKSDSGTLQLPTMDAPFVYIEHHIFPNEIPSLNPNESFADWYGINENNIPFLIEKPWTYSECDDIVENRVLDQLVQQLKEENEESDDELYQRTTYRSHSGQPLFTMTYFKHLPKSIVFSTPGMSGGGVFDIDNGALNLVAISVSGRLNNILYIPFPDIPEMEKSQSTFYVSILELKVLIWPFWKEFLEECEENREESKFRHIMSAKTVTDKNISSSNATVPEPKVKTHASPASAGA